MTDQIPTNIQLAFILDDKIVDIINTDERLAAIFLSQPVVVDITNMPKGPEGSIFIHSKYNSETNTFTAPTFDPEGNLID